MEHDDIRRVMGVGFGDRVGWYKVGATRAVQYAVYGGEVEVPRAGLLLLALISYPGPNCR